MQENITTKTNGICNELYYVQNFRITGWFRKPATTKIELPQLCDES